MKTRHLLIVLAFISFVFIGHYQLSAQNSELYGTTSKGGQYDVGTIFKTDGNGNNYTTVHDFVSYEGMRPLSTLCQAENGKLYGMTQGYTPFNGEPDNFGALFEWDPVTNVYSKKLDFSGDNGSDPIGSLVQADNGLLYGMTYQGGKLDVGVVFSWDPATGVYSKIFDFSSEIGCHAYGTLMKANNGMLYGMTSSGGKYSDGVIFEVNPNTAVYTKIFDFNGIESGSFPMGSFIQAADGFLYAMTRSGGTYGKGVIFKWNLCNHTLTKIFEFNREEDGIYPWGSLVQAYDGKLYGMTYSGGAYGEYFDGVFFTYGTLFQFDPATNIYIKKLDFNGVDNGSFPRGYLLQANNGRLYGGAGGVLFEWDPVTDTYTKIDDRGIGNGSLIQASDGKIYGAFGGGGLADWGILFELDPITKIITKRLDFHWAENGKCPSNDLVQALNGKLYGSTPFGGNGGNGGWGVIYEWDHFHDVLAKKFDFQENVTGYGPYGSMVLANSGKLYGLTKSGQLYEWNPVTNTLTVKLYFQWGEMGGEPCGSLIQAKNGKLYGMTRKGGWLNNGILYEWDPITGIYTKILEFDGYNTGGNPDGSLLQANNGKIYGMTTYGGINDYGVLFEWDPATDIYTKKIDFNGTENGSSPTGSLEQVEDGILFGMTQKGGTYNSGTLFKWDPFTNIFTKLFDFDGTDKGSFPKGSLMLAENQKLYGLTSSGGQYNKGVLFEWDPVTNTYTKKFDFNGSDGSTPQGGLIEVKHGTVTDTTINLGKGLVAYYPFNGNANDESGNGFDGFVEQAVLTNDRFGNTNSAYSFNGNNATIQLTNAVLNDFIYSSLSLWVCQQGEEPGIILSKQHDWVDSYYILGIGVYNIGGGFAYGDTGRVYFRAKNNSQLLCSKSLLESNKWNHLAITIDTSVKLFINGVLDTTISASDFSLPDDLNATTTNLGTWLQDGNYDGLLKGKLDDIRIYNRILNTSEISELYNTPDEVISPPQTSDITVCEGQQVPDLMAVGINIRWYSDPQLTHLLHEGNSFATGETAVGKYTYYVTQSFYKCQSLPDMVTLTINSRPAAPVTDSVIVCEGKPVPVLTAIGENIQWYTDTNYMNPVDTGNNFTTHQNLPGTYTYYVSQTVSGCESDLALTTLIIYSLPVIKLGDDTTLYSDQEYTLGPFPEAYSYLWNDGSNNTWFNVSGEALGLGVHQISVMVSDMNGCAVSDTILISVVSNTGIYNNLNSLVRIYPNPTDGSLTIDLGSMSATTVVTINSADGRIMQKEESKNSCILKMELNTQPGIYFLTIVSDNERWVCKIVKN